MKFLITIVVAILLMIATTSVAFSQTTDLSQITNSTELLTLKVKGITCSSDVKMISANVEKLNGVASCKAEKMSTTTTFIVNYIPAIISASEINAAIENTAGCKSPEQRPYKVKP